MVWAAERSDLNLGSGIEFLNRPGKLPLVSLRDSTPS